MHSLQLSIVNPWVGCAIGNVVDTHLIQVFDQLRLLPILADHRDLRAQVGDQQGVNLVSR